MQKKFYYLTCTHTYIFFIIALVHSLSYAITEFEIIHSIQTRNFNALRQIITMRSVDVEIEGNGLLHYAVRENAIDVIDFLLRAGIKVNTRNKKYETAVDIAGAAGRWNIVLALIQHGALNTSTYDLETLYLIAACSYHASIDFFISLGFRLERCVIDKQRALFILAFEYNNPHMISITFKRPILEVQNVSCGLTSIEFARARGYGYVLSNFYKTLEKEKNKNDLLTTLEEAVGSENNLYISSDSTTQQLFKINRNNPYALAYIQAVEQGDVTKIKQLLPVASPMIVRNEYNQPCLATYAHTMARYRNEVNSNLILYLLESFFL